MVAECDRRYPGLRRETERAEKDPGVVAYLLNTLIDLEALGYGVRGPDAMELPQPRGTHSGHLHDEEKDENTPVDR